jgi:hypothetical protein
LRCVSLSLWSFAEFLEGGAAAKGAEAADDDDVPELVGNFEDASKAEEKKAWNMQILLQNHSWLFIEFPIFVPLSLPFIRWISFVTICNVSSQVFFLFSVVAQNYGHGIGFSIIT